MEIKECSNVTKTHKCKDEIFIQPWSSFSEFKACYDLMFGNCYDKFNQITPKVNESLDKFIYNLNIAQMKIAVNMLSIWLSRNDNLSFVLSSYLLAETIEKYLEHKIPHTSDTCHMLAQKIIRVTNLLVDDLKKKNRAMSANMFLVAKEIDLPEFIIDIRHACTHKNIPSLDALLFAIKYLFHWIKEKIWDHTYYALSTADLLKEKILFALDEPGTGTKEKKLNSLALADIESVSEDCKTNGIHLEIDGLFEIIDKFTEKFISKLTYANRKISLNQNLDMIIKVYKALQSIEGINVPILFFKYITQQVNYLICQILSTSIEDRNFSSSSYLNEHDQGIQSLLFLGKFIVKYNTLAENFNKEKTYEKLVGDIQSQLKFSKDFSSVFGEILNCFHILLKNMDSQKKGSDSPSVSQELKCKKEKSSWNFSNQTDAYYQPSGSLLFDRLTQYPKEKTSEYKDQISEEKTEALEVEQMNVVADKLNDIMEFEMINTLIL